MCACRYVLCLENVGSKKDGSEIGDVGDLYVKVEGHMCTWCTAG